MKNYFCLFFLLSYVYAPAQQIFVEIGRTLSSFDYEDSEGQSLSGLSGASYGSMTVGYRAPIAKEKWFITTGLGLNRYGASGSDPVLDNYYEWDVTYLSVPVLVEYEIGKLQNFFTEQDGLRFYAKLGVAPEILVQGTQLLNDQVYNLSGVEQFDSPYIFVRGGLSMDYCVSKKFVVFFNYLFGKSFSFSTDMEKLSYLTHTFNFGLMFNLPNCKYCQATY